MAQGVKGSGIKEAVCSRCGRYRKIARKKDLLCNTCYEHVLFEEDPEKKKKYLEWHRENNRKRYEADPEYFRKKALERYHKQHPGSTSRLAGEKRQYVPRKTVAKAKKKVYLADESCSLCGRIVPAKDAVEYDGNPAHQVCVWGKEARERLKKND